MNPHAKDSCHSWLIALACHVIYFLLFGMARIAGLLYVEAMPLYNIEREQASLPFVIAFTVMNLVGPLAGYLGHTLGFRPVICFGTVLASIGIGLCVFPENIQLVCFLWGGVYGLGTGMATAFLPQVINLHFEKHASKANGLSIAGVAVAGFVLSPIVTALLNTYGLKGTYLILSALILNALPAAMILKMPADNSSTGVKSNPKHQDNKTAVKHPITIKDNSVNTVRVNSSTVVFSNSNNKSGVTEEVFIDAKDSFGQFDKLLEEPSHHNLIKTPQDPNSKCTPKRNNGCAQSFSIFLDPAFILISIPRCLSTFFFLMLPTIIVDFSHDKKLTNNEALYVLMSFSGFDLFGKIVLGWITDGGYLTKSTYSVICFCIMAASLSFMVWAKGFVMFLIGVAGVSTCVGTLSPTFPGLVRQYLEKEKQTMAIASSLVLLVPLNFSTTPLIGYFRDNIGSYDWLFYIMSINCLICGFLLLLLPSVSRRTRKR